MDFAYRELRLNVPSLTQGNMKNPSNDWCGRTASSMAYNYYQAAAGTTDFIVNDPTAGDLLYPASDGGGIAGMTSDTGSRYFLSSIVNRGLKKHGDKTVSDMELYPLAGRLPDPDDATAARLLEPLFRALEAFHPIVIYTSFSSASVEPQHIILVSGYRIDDQGIWLHFDDPAPIHVSNAPTSGPDAGSKGGKLTKYQTLVGPAALAAGQADTLLKIVQTGGGWDVKVGAKYWLRVHRLLAPNENTGVQGDLLCDYNNKSANVVARCKVLYPPIDVKMPDRAVSLVRAGFRIPIDFSAGGKLAPIVGGTTFEKNAEGLMPKRAVLDQAFNHTEKEASGGFFPIGANTTWHGGLHLRSQTGEGRPVCAPFVGEVLAARLRGRAAGEDPGWWGSSNFVLMRHRLDPLTAEQALSLHVTTHFEVVKLPVAFTPDATGIPPLISGDRFERVDAQSAPRRDQAGEKVPVRLQVLSPTISRLDGWFVASGKLSLTEDADGKKPAFALMAGDLLMLTRPCDRHRGDPEPAGRVEVTIASLADKLIHVWSWRVKKGNTVILREQADNQRRADSQSKVDRNRVALLVAGDLVERVNRNEEPTKVGSDYWYRVKVREWAPNVQQVDRHTLKCERLSLREAPRSDRREVVFALGPGDVVRLIQKESAPNYDTIEVVSYATSIATQIVVPAATDVFPAQSGAAPIARLPKGTRVGIVGLSVYDGTNTWTPVEYATTEEDPEAAADGYSAAAPQTVVGSGWIKTTQLTPDPASRQPKSSLSWCNALIGRRFYCDTIQKAWVRDTQQSPRPTPEGLTGWVKMGSSLSAEGGEHRAQVYAPLVTPPGSDPVARFYLKVDKSGLVETGQTRAERFASAIGKTGTLTVDFARVLASTSLPDSRRQALADRSFFSLCTHLDDRRALKAGDAATEALRWLPRVPRSAEITAECVPFFQEATGTLVHGMLRSGDAVEFTGSRQGSRWEARVTTVSPGVEGIRYRVTKTCPFWKEDNQKEVLGALLPGDVLEAVPDRPRGNLRLVRPVTWVSTPVELRYEVTAASPGRFLLVKMGAKSDTNPGRALRLGDRYEVVAASEFGRGRWNRVRILHSSASFDPKRSYWISRTGLDPLVQIETGPRPAPTSESGFLTDDDDYAEETQIQRASVFDGLTGWMEMDRKRMTVSDKLDPKILEAFQRGDVVHLGAGGGGQPPVYPRIDAGDTLGYTGLFGSPDPEHPSEERSPQVHWEFFSETNLLDQHAAARFAIAVEDMDRDYNLDQKAVLGLVRAILNAREPGLGDKTFADHELSADEVKGFYNGQDKGIVALRRCAARFACEWGMNLEVAVPALHLFKRIRDPKQREQLIGAVANRVRDQLWWDEAQQAGVPVPGKHVWHYHPLGFVELFSEADLAREAKKDNPLASDAESLPEIPFDPDEALIHLPDSLDEE